MKKRLVAVLLCTTLLFSMTACSKKTEEVMENQVETETEVEEPEEQPAEEVEEEKIESLMGYNMITNGDFATDSLKWGTYFNGGNAAVNIQDGQLVVKVLTIGSEEHSAQVYYDGFALETGCVYQLDFDASSSAAREIAYRIQINGGDYHAYTEEMVALDSNTQHYTYEFTMEEGSDPAPRFCFNMGLCGTTDAAIGEHEIIFDNFELYCTDETNRALPAEKVEMPNVLVNQVGFRTNDYKNATFRGDSIGTEFEIVDEDSKECVYTGKIGPAAKNASTKENEAFGEFTDFNTPGNYIITSEGCGESFAFTIADDIYQQAMKDTVRMLYLQRCGQELTKEQAGDFAHAACHTGEAILVSDGSIKLDVSGGWHDAGDFGRYVVSGAKAVADLMLAYEKNPDAFSDDYDIPESNNQIPDILDEARYELEWLLKMQDKASGGVYHKVTCKNFPETVMPEEEVEQLYLSPISNCATGDFAAVMAMAARIYSDIDKDFADNCLSAAKSAATYLETSDNGDGFLNPTDIVTGEYPDDKDMDEIFWANAELYKTTGDKTYEEKLLSMKFLSVPCNLGWQKVGFYGGYAYLTSEEINEEYAQTIKDKFLYYIDGIKENAKADTFQSTMGDVYPWGSNMTIANNGMVLIMMDEIEGTNEYSELAQAQLHYLFGNNTTGYCFLTGYGDFAPESTHHRPSQVLGTTMKAMLVGGPDSNLEDPFAKATMTGTAPAKCYVDNAQSFSCNEVCVYWNSPLIYLLSNYQ